MIIKPLTLYRPFSDVFCSPVFSHLSVEGGVIQGPPVLPAGGLNKSCQVRFWNVQAWEPHHFWFTLINLQSVREDNLQHLFSSPTTSLNSEANQFKARGQASLTPLLCNESVSF